ncbi:MAG TPA: MarR family transcriptional regulator [Candidatus Thermoplasmatota archaeon]|nr:MarR family transcriptional regulator [Candidatus Thermoplasmatota archaeon]
MRYTGKVALAALVVLAPLALAQGSAELVSASPVELFGDVRAETAGLTLYHAAFENGTFSGTIYNGTVVERHRHVQPGCGLNYEEEHVLQSVGAQDLRFITFEVHRGSVVTAGFAGDEVVVGQGVPSGSAPVAYLGPNPYAYAEAADPGSNYYDPYEARAFPIERFLVVPHGKVKAATGGRVTLEMGAVVTSQAGASSTHRSDVVFDQSECPSGGPLPFPSNPQRTTVKTIQFYFTSGVLEADQRLAEGTLAYWHGERGLDDPPDTRPSRRGYWTRTDGETLDEAFAANALPATSFAGSKVVAATDGRARFREATGTISDEQSRTIGEPTDLDLSGALRLSPVHEEDAGRRMTTRLDGSLYDVDLAATDGLDWQAFLFGAAGGGLLLGAAVYAWPSARWRFTRLLFFPLYARLRKEEILENPLRDDILHAVEQQPGISASELGRRLECGWGTLVYHLTVLERMQLVSSAREGRHKRFFAQGRINYTDKGAVGLLANPAARTILDAIRAVPGIIQKELGERLNLAAGTIAWHVERLEAEGLVVREEDGRSVRYFPSDRLLKLTERLAA